MVVNWSNLLGCVWRGFAVFSASSWAGKEEGNGIGGRWWRWGEKGDPLVHYFSLLLWCSSLAHDVFFLMKYGSVIRILFYSVVCGIVAKALTAGWPLGQQMSPCSAAPAVLYLGCTCFCFVFWGGGAQQQRGA